MKNSLRIFLSLLIIIAALSCNLPAQENGSNQENKDKIIFAYGGAPNLTFIDYVAKLTGKENPKICYVPTAAADNRRSAEE